MSVEEHIKDLSNEGFGVERRSGSDEWRNYVSELTPEIVHDALDAYVAAKDITCISLLVDGSFEAWIGSDDRILSLLPFNLLRESFNLLTLQNAIELLPFYQSRRDTWLPAMDTASTVVVLKILKKLLDRMHPVIHYKPIENILIYTGCLLGPLHGSRLNKRGKSNSTVLVDIDVETGNSSYNDFWQLQKSLSDPGVIIAPETLTKFYNRAQKVARRYNELFGEASDKEEATSLPITALWNTDVIAFQEMESNRDLWCILAIQILFVLDYILTASIDSKRSSARTGLQVIPAYTLSPQESARATELRKEWSLLLQKASDFSGHFRKSFECYMALEREWIEWKKQGCPNKFSPLVETDKKISDGLIDSISLFTEERPLYQYQIGNSNIAGILNSDISPDPPIRMHEPSVSVNQDSGGTHLGRTRKFGSWGPVLNFVREQPEVQLPELPELAPRQPEPKPQTIIEQPHNKDEKEEDLGEEDLMNITRKSSHGPGKRSSSQDEQNNPSKRPRTYDSSGPRERLLRSEIEGDSITQSQREERFAATVRPGANSAQNRRSLAPY